MWPEWKRPRWMKLRGLKAVQTEFDSAISSFQNDYFDLLAKPQDDKGSPKKGFPSLQLGRKMSLSFCHVKLCNFGWES